jgi:two-component system response regulator PilR (NtrC family)/two-component system response regulator HydG
MANESILLVEDDRELRALLLEVLEVAGYDVRAAASGTEALAALAHSVPDLVITDLMMPGVSGKEVLKETRRAHPGVNVIVITAFGSIESAIELVKEGAFDYLTKPFSNDELLLAAQRALEERGSRRASGQQQGGAPGPVPGFLGTSGPTRALLEMVGKVARSPLPVLITGETGTGKELVARGIHSLSGRDPFLAVNCAALPDHLLESELFGHERGSFTGADRAKPGLFEAAHGGTLLLDEVAELPAPLQPKLLRALEDGEIRRVGSTRPTRVDVRLLAATNRDLDEEIAAGRFRQDLFWRLNGLALHIPPLRERPADVAVLVEHFLERFAESAGRRTPQRFSPEAVALLASYPWPGNARELRSAVERAATLAEGDVLPVESLPERVRHGGLLRTTVAEAAVRQLSMAEVERAYILEILRVTGGNRSRAAEILGLDRKTLYRKLQEYASEADAT